MQDISSNGAGSLANVNSTCSGEKTAVCSLAALAGEYGILRVPSRDIDSR